MKLITMEGLVTINVSGSFHFERKEMENESLKWFFFTCQSYKHEVLKCIKTFLYF